MGSVYFNKQISIKVNIVQTNFSNKAEVKNQKEEKIPKKLQRVNNSHLNPEWTFDSFVLGKANQLARAAAQQICDNPGLGYNPFFLYGGVGLGKTHLIHAVGNTILDKKQSAGVKYIHAESYVSDVVKAYQTKSFEEF